MYEQSVDCHYSSCVDVNEQAETALKLWPNPASEILLITSEDLLQMKIFSMDGNLLMGLDKGCESINVSSLPLGCHLLKATFTNGRTAMQKFVKE